MGHYDPKEKGKGMFGDLPCAVLAHELLNPGRAGRSPRPWSFYALVTALTAVIIIGGLDLAVHLGQHEYDDHSGFSVAPRKGLLGRCNSNTLRQWAPGDHFGEHASAHVTHVLPIPLECNTLYTAYMHGNLHSWCKQSAQPLIPLVGRHQGSSIQHPPATGRYPRCFAPFSAAH